MQSPVADFILAEENDHILTDVVAPFMQYEDLLNLWALNSSMRERMLTRRDALLDLVEGNGEDNRTVDVKSFLPLVSTGCVAPDLFLLMAKHLALTHGDSDACCAFWRAILPRIADASNVMRVFRNLLAQYEAVQIDLTNLEHAPRLGIDFDPPRGALHRRESILVCIMFALVRNVNTDMLVEMIDPTIQDAYNRSMGLQARLHLVSQSLRGMLLDNVVAIFKLVAHIAGHFETLEISRRLKNLAFTASTGVILRALGADIESFLDAIKISGRRPVYGDRVRIGAPPLEGDAMLFPATRACARFLHVTEPYRGDVSLSYLCMLLHICATDIKDSTESLADLVDSTDVDVVMATL
jgi:hypothetical protein